MKEKVFKLFASEVKAVDEEKREVTSIISNESEDRDKDVILAKGWNFKNYRKNPVVLWGHNYSQPPIAKTISVKAEGEDVIATRRYASAEDYAFADTIFRLIKGGFQRAVSVGFKPIKWKRRDELPEDSPYRVEPDPDAGFFHSPGVLFQKQELLEYSDVPVPANPEALNLALEKGAINEGEFKDLSKIPCFTCEKASLKSLCTPSEDCETKIEVGCREFGDNMLNGKTSFHIPSIMTWGQQGGTVTVKISEGIFEDEESEQNEVNDNTIVSLHDKGAVGVHTTPRSEEHRLWDKGEAIKRLKGLYKIDPNEGTGNWADYRKAFTWYNGEEPKSLGSYKLPHHDLIDENVEVVWKGVEAAMRVLRGAKGGVNIPESDRQGVYNHLARHYRQFDKEPPDFKTVEMENTIEKLRYHSDMMRGWIDMYSRCLEISPDNPEKVFEKVFDELRKDAEVIHFPTLEAAVRALEVDTDSKALKINERGDNVSVKDKELLERVATIVEKMKMHKVLPEGAGALRPKDKVKTVGVVIHKYDVDKLTKELQKGGIVRQALGEEKKDKGEGVLEALDSCLDKLHEKEKGNEVLEALNNLDNSVQSL